MSKNTLSASGARIRGDDYQHLVAWYQILQALRSEVDVVKIGIEDPNPATGNADDVTIYRRLARNEFYQVKLSVDARELVNYQWLTSPSRAGGPSIIQRFYEAWQDLTQDTEHPKLFLVTNRPIDPSDPIIKLRDGHDGTLARQLKNATGRSAAGQARQKIAKHLDISEAELIEFLSDLHFNIGHLFDEWVQQASTLMYAHGLKCDKKAVQEGITTVRGWVTSGRRLLTVDEVRQEIDALGLKVKDPASILSVQAIDHDPMAESATIALNWVELFQGDEPRTRRKLYDSQLWNTRLRPDIQAAKLKLRRNGVRRVLVRGYMRLPTWFTVGNELGVTAGFDVATFQGGEEWASNVPASDFSIVAAREEVIGNGRDIAIGISVAVDLSEDAFSYIVSNVHTVGRYVGFSPTAGPSVNAIRNSSEARGCALNVRDHVRELARKYRPDKLHLFLATPKGFALLLGHFWDRMPDTQLYEDQGSGYGYLPSFFIPN